MGDIYEIIGTGASKGTEKSIVNSTEIIEVGQASDLPATLVADTTYIIRGEITITTTIAITNDGCAIIGQDRNRDKLIYTGAGTLFTITDVNFTLRNLHLSATNGNLLSATNITTGSSADNYGRTKVLVIDSCEIRNTTNVWYIQGFELVDLNNVLIWYIVGTTGCQFQSNRHLQINSCELFNWQDEPTGTTFSTASMIELQQDTAGTGGEAGNTIGFAVINIGGSIIHPIRTQIGMDIATLSTVAFGTISSNTFIDVGITSGEIFSPVPASGGYSLTSTLNYDIAVNQGIPNSISYILVTFTGNTNDTDLSSGTPAPIEEGGLATTQNSQRFTMSVVTIGASVNDTPVITYNGTKPLYVSIAISLSFDKQGGGTDGYIFTIHKDTGGVGSYVELAGSAMILDAGGDADELGVSMTYATTLEENDILAVFCENPSSGDDMLVKNFQWLVKE